MTDVFSAVADPTRRSILEYLRKEGPLSISALSKPFPMSRQAVTKHLSILEEAGLIQGAVAGREKIHRLRTDPLREVDEWLAPYAAAWDERLGRLKNYLAEEIPEGRRP